MFHDLSPRSREDQMIAEGLKVLRERIAAAKIPSSKLDESLNFATWNVRDFGKSRRSKAAIHYIAEIMGQFDLIALVELRDKLDDLRRVLNILGPYWKVIFNDFDTDAAGNRERVAFVYDQRMVYFTGLAAEAGEPRKKNRTTKKYESAFNWWRSPYMASFVAGNFDFMLVATHIRWGSGEDDRMEEIEALAQWISKRVKEKGAFDRDIIACGDFNIPSVKSDLYKAFSSRGWTMPRSIIEGSKGSNLEAKKRYDQILYNSKFTTLDNPKGGVLDFYQGDFAPLFPAEFFPGKTKKDLTWELSDHLPLWMQIDTWSDDETLDQIIRSKKPG
ncbi:MAG TPA: endonuclease/exonuclease/phosphatase family protein [Thermohalobaculum sp.]|nr:endonuclease/exonuclease/phosphatase family protein [Thermohalobaculum sp.]